MGFEACCKISVGKKHFQKQVKVNSLLLLLHITVILQKPVLVMLYPF